MKRPSSKNATPEGKKKIRTMDLILVIVGIALLVFTAVMIWLFTRFGAVPDTLITCVFAALGGECGIMGWIKTTKERNKEREWEKEDREAAKAEAKIQEQEGINNVSHRHDE